jgi:uncharacterized membrane protein YphA (DoxX/SURF4 family)
MTIALWIVNALLALVFLAAGAMKLARPKAALIERGMGWAQGVSDTNVKLIGLAEVLGAIGLILPLAVNIAPVLTPIAAIGLAVVMIGAAVTHVRRKESYLTQIVLLLLSVVSAVLGFIVI